MLKPTILQSLFDLKMDSGINTRILRKIYKILHLKYDAKKDRFKVKTKCDRVRISDQHDDEAKPHYILDLLLKDGTSGEMVSYAVRYCDYHSKKSNNGKNVIETAPGRWYIDLWLPKGSDLKPKKIAKKISLAYAKAMEKELPDYEIVFAEDPIRVR